MSDATIKVPEGTRDHLAVLAKERGTTIGALVAHLAAEQLTTEQISERVKAARSSLRAHMNCTLSDEELDAMPNVLERVYQVAAEKARAAAARKAAA